MEASASSLIGRTLAGGVTLDAYIGEGGFARIYQGRRGSPPVDVAVKVLHAEFLADEVFLLRFEREAKTAISVAHPNAVQILEYGIDDGVAFIVMELVRGVSVFDVLVRERRLTQKRAVKIMTQICDALEAAHGQGIVHRDVKPENIMLLGDPSDAVGEWVKVLDFGIAKLLFDEGAAERDDDAPESARAALTGLGTVLGTPEYMAPEQLRGEQIDRRADVYACGVLLYQLVTGEVPFSGVTPAHTAVLQLEQPPKPPTSIVPEVHPELERIILKALSKSPGERQQSAEQLRDELTKVTRVLPEGAPPPPRAEQERAALEVAPTLMVAATPATGAGGTMVIGDAAASPHTRQPPSPSVDAHAHDDAATTPAATARPRRQVQPQAAGPQTSAAMAPKIGIAATLWWCAAAIAVAVVVALALLLDG
jgi:serine/threonine-protein kinase